MDTNRKSLLYKVARLYYEEKLKKFQIARLIDCSATQVANLLREAEDDGILRIEVCLPRLERLRLDLIHRFDVLKDAIVIPHETVHSVLLRLLGKAAAEYFDVHVGAGARVALGGGFLVYELISSLTDKKRDVDAFPLALIGQGPDISHIDPMIVLTMLWAKSGRLPNRAHYMTILPPENVGSLPEVKKHYDQLRKSNKKIRELLEQITKVDFAFASIGGMEVDQGYQQATQDKTQNMLSVWGIEKNDLREKGVVGDIAYSFYDTDGQQTRPEWDPTPSIGVKGLQRLAADPQKRVVVVVGGYKITSLRAALRGRLFNVLICDEITAEALLAPGLDQGR